MPTPPKSPEHRRRRNATVPMGRLPKERVGPLPKWPLAGKHLPGETDLWCDLWSRPQAVVWESQRLERIVARYCRLLIQSEIVGAPVTIVGEVRQLEDKLLLNPKALKLAHYEVAEDELDERRGEPAPSAPRRLKAVDSSAAV